LRSNVELPVKTGAHGYIVAFSQSGDYGQSGFVESNVVPFLVARVNNREPARMNIEKSNSPSKYKGTSRRGEDGNAAHDSSTTRLKIRCD
jgi:hypothetical protein